MSTKIEGRLLDLSRILEVLSKYTNISDYGINETVTYVAPYYSGKSVINADNIPVINITGRDYFIFEITLDTNWLDNHNLLVFTPYIYSYGNSIIWGSVDSSLFLSKSLLSKENKINICCTASKEIAQKYSELGFLISKLPIDYILNSTINIILRVGNLTNEKLFINDNVKTFFNTTSDANLNYYTSEDIIAKCPLVYPPINNPETKQTINTFKAIQLYFKNLNTFKYYELYPYFSSYVNPPVNYPIQSFYDSVNLTKLEPSREPINILGNNTCENYFMSNDIPLQEDTNKYIYLLYINQFDAGAGCTSNIHIYDQQSNYILAVYSAADLPPMSSPQYPIPLEEDTKQFPPYGLYIIPMNVLYDISNGLDVVICERICYNLINSNHTEYKDINVMSIFTGSYLSSEQLKYLYTTYPSLKITNYTLPST